MMRVDLREILTELRHELPAGIVHDFEDGILEPAEAWQRIERLIGEHEISRLLEGRKVELRAVDRAALAYRRRREGREAWSEFETPEGVAT